MENIFAIRLSSARKMAGMSLQKLADALGNVVTKQSLNKYEQGKMKPDSSLLIKLSNILNVPVDYFYSVPSVDVRLENPDYRRHSSKVSKTEQYSIEERIVSILERYLELEDRLGLPDESHYFNYKDIIRNSEDAENAAKELRKQWKLGYDPIPDVVAMLEDKGYRIVELEASDSFDGMAADVNGKKIIVLNSKKYNENIVRKRFTALHELAHHALSINEELDHKASEKLCHVFASAVLYPEDMARRELHQQRFRFFEPELIILKERWGISIAAIFQRAHKLGIIQDHILKSLQIEYSRRGYRKGNNEPGDFPSNEKSVKFERLIYFALAKEVISINEAAYYSGKSVWEFREQMHQFI